MPLPSFEEQSLLSWMMSGVHISRVPAKHLLMHRKLLVARVKLTYMLGSWIAGIIRQVNVSQRRRYRGVKSKLSMNAVSET